jgi:hypothetical protein
MATARVADRTPRPQDDIAQLKETAHELRQQAILLSHVMRGLIHAPAEMNVDAVMLEPVYTHFVVGLEVQIRDFADQIDRITAVTIGEAAAEGRAAPGRKGRP